MGKAKPRVRQKNRAHLVAKPVKPPSDPELATLREQRILPVLQDLQSAELKTRSAATTAITNLITDTKCRKLLLREQIVKVVMQQTLTDSSLETRATGFSILKSLAIEEEADFCVHLYREDILTAIEGVLRSIVQTIECENPAFNQLPFVQRQLVWTLTNSIVTLLSTLAEAQDEIVAAITKLPTLVTFLLGLLSFESTPEETDIDILVCLIALTEDNKPLAKELVGNDQYLKKFLQISRSAEAKAVPACGVLHNVFSLVKWYDHNTPYTGCSDAALVKVLVQNMEVPTTNSTSGTNINNGSSSNSNPDEVLQLAMEITASIATGLQEALEHGSKYEEEFEGFEDDDKEVSKVDEEGDTEIKDDDDDEMKDGEDEDIDDDDDKSMNSDDIAADMDLILGEGPEDEEGNDDEPVEEETLERLIRSAAPRLLLFARLSTPNINPSLQSHALAALNNIAWTVASVDFSTGHLGGIQKFWALLAKRVWNEVISPVLASNTADIELASAITSLAWAVARSVQGAIQIQPGEQQKFMALYQASRNLAGPGQNGTKNESEDQDAFQGLGVKVIGVLGRLALDPAPVELNREIGVFVVTVLAALPDTLPADAVQAMNEVYDIYADKSFAFDEPVFWGDGFYKHLEDIQPKFKQMAKGIDKRIHGELRARADEAVLNLPRFLKYKRKEKSESHQA